MTEPEYRGEAAHRPGHILGAISLPWDSAVKPDRLIRPTAELQAMFPVAGVGQDDPVVTYCRVGECSAHTWLLLLDLLGLDDVCNYDGSWCEWGSVTGMPIQLGPDPGGFPAGCSDYNW